MKYKKTILTICIIACVLFSVSAVMASDVNETVMSNEDGEQIILETAEETAEDEMLESDDGTFTALQNKINNAASGSTITLENDYVYNKGFDTNGITISKSLTIIGNGYRMDGAETARIFDVKASNVVFMDINFVNGYAYGDDNTNKRGGAINSYRDTSIAINCTFTHNRAQWYGGAMYGGSAIGCTFTDNAAEYDGGAICEGSASNSIFKECSAMEGGAIYTLNWNVVIDNCNFISCNSRSGIVSECDVSNSIFKDCTGAGVRSANIINCTFTNCEHAFNAQKRNEAQYCTFINCGDETTVGGIVKYCLFKGNSKPSSDSKLYRHCKIDIVQSGTYFRDKTLTVKIIDTDNNLALSNIDVKLNFNNGQTIKLTTDSQGVAKYEIPFNPGTYALTASINDEKLDCQDAALNNIIIEKAPGKLSSAKITTVYKAKNSLNVKLINSKTNKALSGIKVLVKIYTGKKYAKHTLTTNNNGIASLAVNGLGVGNHKVVISCSDSRVSAKSITTSINVKKSNPVLSTYSYKPYLAMTLHGKGIVLKDKSTKKPLVGVKVKFKLYTSSKKYKTFTLVTDNYGKCALFTNKYSIGNHKLIISISDSVLKLKSKTVTYNIKSNEKFKLQNNNAFFNILYTNGKTKIG